MVVANFILSIYYNKNAQSNKAYFILKNGYIKPMEYFLCVCCVCLCGWVMGEGQEWAMRMKRNRENKYVKSK